MKNFKNIIFIILRWIKDNWLKILVILAITGAFYWYEIRPTQIRKKCAMQFGNYDLVKEIGKVENMERLMFIGANENMEAGLMFCGWLNGLEK